MLWGLERGCKHKKTKASTISQPFNRFSDPVVLLDRISTETKTANLSQCENKFSFGETVRTLALKGNEGLRATEPHTCCACQKVFSYRKSLKFHLENVHCKPKKLFCDLCSKICFSRSAMSNHVKVHRKKMECNVCDYKTAHKFVLERHKLNHAAKVKCPICRKKVSYLLSHMIVHKPKKSCPICQKMFRENNFKRHVETHSRTYKCEHCMDIFENNQARRM